MKKIYESPIMEVEYVETENMIAASLDLFKDEDAVNAEDILAPEFDQEFFE